MMKKKRFWRHLSLMLRGKTMDSLTSAQMQLNQLLSLSDLKH
ncbi:hypothetical protein SAMN05192561_1132 [Halopenitus malekzadehii]|uniref:Uncharacterized protein n=1 Tax=Halopenitus malekzadehii TaxID=1267564 RepID=A0A1H6JHI4_9EURY|nr:hypothetical protein SAMN05192561_1132 [Halopenitus malekzadehii]